MMGGNSRRKRGVFITSRELGSLLGKGWRSVAYEEPPPYVDRKTRNTKEAIANVLAEPRELARLIEDRGFAKGHAQGFEEGYEQGRADAIAERNARNPFLRKASRQAPEVSDARAG
jgi:flagellar biosynthesis/type III secretory pathway protein FliH